MSNDCETYSLISDENQTFENISQLFTESFKKSDSSESLHKIGGADKKKKLAKCAFINNMKNLQLSRDNQPSFLSLP